MWDLRFGITMHHKFCVIDHNIVINGSYNWTNKASSNYENITITPNIQLATCYISEVYKMWKSERLWYGNMTYEALERIETMEAKLNNVEETTKIQERLRIAKELNIDSSELMTALFGKSELLPASKEPVDPTKNTEVESDLNNVKDNMKIQERLRIGKTLHLNDDAMLTALLGTTKPR